MRLLWGAVTLRQKTPRGAGIRLLYAYGRGFRTCTEEHVLEPRVRRHHTTLADERSHNPRCSSHALNEANKPLTRHHVLRPSCLSFPSQTSQVVASITRHFNMSSYLNLEKQLRFVSDSAVDRMQRYSLTRLVWCVPP